MKKIYFILILVACINLYGQDENYLYEINYTVRHKYCDRNISSIEHKNLWRYVKDTYDLDNRDKNELSLFSVKEIINYNGASVFRTGVDCYDCRLQYTLFYEFEERIVFIDGDDPLKLLNKVLAEFKKDKVVPNEETVNKITKEVFFYVKYTAAHANFSGIPLYKEGK